MCESNSVSILSTSNDIGIYPLPPSPCSINDMSLHFPLLFLLLPFLPRPLETLISRFMVNVFYIHFTHSRLIWRNPFFKLEKSFLFFFSFSIPPHTHFLSYSILSKNVVRRKREKFERLGRKRWCHSLTRYIFRWSTDNSDSPGLSTRLLSVPLFSQSFTPYTPRSVQRDRRI